MQTVSHMKLLFSSVGQPSIVTGEITTLTNTRRFVTFGPAESCGLKLKFIFYIWVCIMETINVIKMLVIHYKVQK